MSKPAAQKKKKRPATETRGRPRLAFRKALADRIAREISLGKSLRKVLKGRGMPRMVTVMNWLQDNPAWVEQYARAKKTGIELHIDDILDLADSATPENAHAVRLRVDTRKWLASKILPKVYGDKLTADPEATPSNPLSELELARGVAFLLYRAMKQPAAPRPALLELVEKDITPT